MVPNPPYHVGGDFVLDADRVAIDGGRAPHVRQHRHLRHRAVPRTSSRRENQNAAALSRVDHARASFRVSATTGPGRTSARPPSLPHWMPPWMLTRRRCLAGRFASGAARTTLRWPIAQTTTIPCSISRGLPRFDRIRSGDIAPAIDALLAAARASVDAVDRDTRPETWDTVVQPTETAFDHLDRAMGRRPASECRRQHDRPARRLQHGVAEGDRVLHGCRAGSALVRALSGARGWTGLCRTRRRAAQRRRQRVTRFPPGRRRAPGCRQGTAQGGPGRARDAVGPVRRQCARRRKRVGALRPDAKPISPAFPRTSSPQRARRRKRMGAPATS